MTTDMTVDYEVLGELFRRQLESYLREYLGPEGFDNFEYKHTLEDEGLLCVSVKSRKERWERLFYLYVTLRIYPSQLPQFVTRLNQKAREKKGVHILAVPHLSKTSRNYLRHVKFPYIDLAGGFYLSLALPGKELTIVVDEDKSYAAKSWLGNQPPELPGVSQGRIVLYRVLLTHRDKSWGVRELSRHAGLDAGTTSRYLGECVNAGWVERKGRSEHILADATALLDYWVSISRRVGSGFAFYKLMVRDYPELKQRVAEYLRYEPEAYHSLWSGAEFYGHFQEQPIIALYVPEPRKMKEFFERSGIVPPFNLQYSLLVGPTKEEKISNLWLLRTPDKAIGSGAVERDGERVVCWQQVYVDLMNSPRRGKSIAVMLRDTMEKLHAG